ncbi:MAG: TSUP family transporter, partial [Acidimicrobiales bacterium]
GLLAGLLGVGGGIVMMPAFTGLLRMPIKLAVGSSLVAVAMFSIPALIMHTALGHIAWRFALPLMIGVVPGAQVGAHISVGSSDRTMRVLFGSFILVLSVVYGTSEILALR